MILNHGVPRNSNTATKHPLSTDRNRALSLCRVGELLTERLRVIDLRDCPVQAGNEQGRDRHLRVMGRGHNVLAGTMISTCRQRYSPRSSRWFSSIPKELGRGLLGHPRLDIRIAVLLVGILALASWRVAREWDLSLGVHGVSECGEVAEEERPQVREGALSSVRM